MKITKRKSRKSNPRQQRKPRNTEQPKQPKNRWLKRGIIAFIIGFVLSAFYIAPPINIFPQPFHQKPIIINFDGGGLVDDYRRFYEKIEDAGVPVQIKGACISACTLILTLPKTQVCIWPTAKFGFHQASVNGIPQPDQTDLLVAAFYPEAIRAWIEKHGPLKTSVLFMEAKEIFKLGIFPMCEGKE